MDCLRAQELISDALDKAPVDDASLIEAKQHCRDCEECAAFVRGLLAVQRAPLPEPPADSVDRVMAVVRAEAERAARARAAAVAVSAPAAPGNAVVSLPVRDEQPEPPATTFSELLQRARDPRNRQAFLAWSAAAAVLFIAAGFTAIYGVRSILVPPRVTEMEFTGGMGATSDQTAMSAAPEASVPGTSGGDARQSAANSAQFITVSDEVYRYLGPITGLDTSTMTRIATTRTSLDTGQGGRTFDVLTTGDPARAYIADGDRVLSFERVTRSYGGRLYVLRSGRIEAFAQWPTLPEGIREPSAPDGSPVFEPEGTAEGGPTVYRAVGGTSSEGIAIPPNPIAPDQMAGAPGWTWWVPVQ